MSRNLKSRRAKEQCMVKVKYATEGQAWKAAKQLRKKGSLSARPYRCVGLRGDPKHWHVTSGAPKW